MVRASVIIPVYQDVPRLRQVLAALDAQTAPRRSFEVLVVDNGDNAGIEEVVAAHPNARLLREQAPGSYVARNTALKDLRGDVAAFTDADCLPAPDWLEQGLAVLDAHPEAGLVVGDIEVFPVDPAHPTAVELYEMAVAFPQASNVANDHFGHTANAFAPRKVVGAVGPFRTDLKSGGDWEWGNRIHDAGFAIVHAPNARVRHPARHTFREKGRQMRRLIGGRYELHRLARRGDKLPPVRFWREWGINWLPPVFAIRNIWRLLEARHGLRMVGVVWLILYLRVLCLFEPLRLALGRPALR
jgi:glycosyltransferase involved in cell wall biosynthesis